MSIKKMEVKVIVLFDSEKMSPLPSHEELSVSFAEKMKAFLDEVDPKRLHTKIMTEVNVSEMPPIHIEDGNCDLKI
jgi:hypothetical protein